MKASLRRFLHLVEDCVFPPKKKGEPPWRTPLRASPIILVSVALTYALHHAGFFTALENAALDTFLRINPIVQKHTLIVDITEGDFRNQFKELSPLNVDVLRTLVEAIAAGKPRAIVVDLDTGDPSFAALRTLAQNTTPILWARSYKEPEQNLEFAKLLSSFADPERDDPHVRSLAHHDICETVLEPGKVLGGTDDLPMPCPIATMVAGSDGLVRGYCVRVKVSAHERGEPDIQATLPWQAVKIFRPDASWPDNRAMFNFCYDRSKLHRYTAGEVLEWAKENPASWSQMVKDKVVLLGGTYSAGRDFQMTPIGKMAGVELVTMAIESHLQNKAIRPVGDGTLVIADIGAGIGFALLTGLLPPAWVLLLAALLAPVFAGLVSFLAFSKLSMWASFVPVLFGVYLHVIHDHVAEDRETRHELKHLEGQLHALKADAQKPAADIHDE